MVANIKKEETFNFKLLHKSLKYLTIKTCKGQLLTY